MQRTPSRTVWLALLGCGLVLSLASAHFPLPAQGQTPPPDPHLGVKARPS